MSEDLADLSDRELIELELDLQSKVNERSKEPLPDEVQQAPDESTQQMNRLLAVQNERRERLLPDVRRVGSRYEVSYKVQKSDTSVEFTRDSFRDLDGAILRAIEIAEAQRREA